MFLIIIQGCLVNAFMHQYTIAWYQSNATFSINHDLITEQLRHSPHFVFHRKKKTVQSWNDIKK